MNLIAETPNPCSLERLPELPRDCHFLRDLQEFVDMVMDADKSGMIRMEVRNGMLVNLDAYPCGGDTLDLSAFQSIALPDAPQVDQEFFERSCLGKEKYLSLSAAEATLHFFQREGKLRSNSAVGAYNCKFCGSVHLGHSS